MPSRAARRASDVSRWAVCDTTGEGMGAPPGVVNDLRICPRLSSFRPTRGQNMADKENKETSPTTLVDQLASLGGCCRIACRRAWSGRCGWDDVVWPSRIVLCCAISRCCCRSTCASGYRRIIWSGSCWRPSRSSTVAPARSRPNGAAPQQFKGHGLVRKAHVQSRSSCESGAARPYP